MDYLIRLLLLVLLLSFPAHTQAQDIQTAKGVICDTKEQIERFASLDATPDALLVINQDAQTIACALVAVAYVRGEKVADVKVPNGFAHAFEIVVVAVQTPHGWQSVTPTIQYALFPSKDGAA